MRDTWSKQSYFHPKCCEMAEPQLADWRLHEVFRMRCSFCGTYHVVMQSVLGYGFIMMTLEPKVAEEYHEYDKKSGRSTQ